MSSTLEASIFMGKNYSENFHSIKNTGNNPTMKQMFNLSEKLTVGKSDEIYGVTPTNWEDSSWKQLSLVIDEEVISLSHAKVSVFSDSVLCFGKMHQNPHSNTVWEGKLSWFKDSPQYRTLDTIDGEPMELEWYIFPDFATMQLSSKSPRVHVYNERSTRRISRTDHLQVDVQLHHMEIWRQWTGMYC